MLRPLLRVPNLSLILFSLVAQFKLHTCLIDIAKAFLHGDIGDKKVFVMPPPGYHQGVYAEYGADTVWQLHKAVYGLKPEAAGLASRTTSTSRRT